MPDNEQSQRLLIPNSTQIPDVLLDHWMAELSGAEFKVLMYIARRTYGFKKDSDTISLSQLLNGITKENGEVLDRGTGLSRSTLVAALKSLQDRNLIQKQRRSSIQKGDEATCYGLRLNATPVRKSNTGGVRKSNPQHPVRQHPEINTSNIRKESSQKKTKKRGSQSREVLNR
jgi:phage replication O-like protein O